MKVIVLTESSGLIGVFATPELARKHIVEAVLNGAVFDDLQWREVDVVGDNSGPLNDDDDDDEPHYPVLWDGEGDEWRYVGNGLYTLVSFYGDDGKPVLDTIYCAYTPADIDAQFGGVDNVRPAV